MSRITLHEHMLGMDLNIRTQMGVFYLYFYFHFTSNKAPGYTQGVTQNIQSIRVIRDFLSKYLQHSQERFQWQICKRELEDDL